MPLHSADSRRKERAAIRRDIRAGLTLEVLFKEMPECIVELPLISLLEMIPYVGYVRIAELNFLAMQRKINICLPTGALTDRAKQFVVEWEKTRRGKT